MLMKRSLLFLALSVVLAAGAAATQQVGTALVCAGYIADLEARHGKPVLAVNTATYWHALRQHGIADRLEGYGMLLRDH